MTTAPTAEPPAEGGPPSAAGESVPFRFTGSGGGYFRIWIVNLCLTVLTVGIYSAWAKVRTNRYFWGSTRLGAASFDYLANPVAILKGRLLVLAFFAIYGIVSAVFPASEFVFGILFLAALPWAVVRSLVFRARNTAYRNVRFDYRGRYGEAFWVYVWLPILLPFTLGLLYPFLVHQQKRLVVAHSAYGTAPFALDARVGDFYALFGKVALLVLAAGLALGGLAAAAPLVVFALAPVLYLYVFAYIGAGTSNLTYNGVVLGTHRLRSDLRTSALFGIYLTNAVAIVSSAGLLIPWAKVRAARYRVTQLALHPGVDLDSFVAARLEEVGTAGAEFGDMLDIDIGL